MLELERAAAAEKDEGGEADDSSEGDENDKDVDATLANGSKDIVEVDALMLETSSKNDERTSRTCAFESTNMCPRFRMALASVTE